MIATRAERLVADRFRIAGILWCHDPARVGTLWDRYDGFAGPIQKAVDAYALQACLRRIGIYTDDLYLDLCLYFSFD